MPFGFLTALPSVAILPIFGGRDRKVTNFSAAWKAAHFRILSQVSDDNHFIY